MTPPLKFYRHRCGAQVLAGWDGDRCALYVTLDPSPLNLTGEVAALTAGRRTYRVRSGRPDLRDRFSIPGHPPSPDLTVLAEHRCGEVIHRAWLLPPPPVSAPSILTSEEIPF